MDAPIQPTATDHPAAPVAIPITTPANGAPPAKWWGQSMTIWGVGITTLATVLPTIAQAFGIDISAALIHDLGDQIVRFVQSGSAIIGLVITIAGRVRATQPLMRKPISLRI